MYYLHRNTLAKANIIIHCWNQYIKFAYLIVPFFVSRKADSTAHVEWKKIQTSVYSTVDERRRKWDKQPLSEMAYFITSSQVNSTLFELSGRGHTF